LYFAYSDSTAAGRCHQQCADKSNFDRVDRLLHALAFPNALSDLLPHYTAVAASKFLGLSAHELQLKLKLAKVARSLILL
jgi:hypothetical protein